MKIQKKIYLSTALGLIVGTVACKKQVNIDPPVTKIVTTSVFNDNNTATAAMLSIYGQAAAIPDNLHRFTAWSSDELKCYSTDALSSDLFMNSLVNNDGAGSLNTFTWSIPYNLIYQCNAVLENVPQSKGLNNRVKRQLTGESQFMRSYLYFNLVNLYGDVPLVTATDYNVSSVLPRTSKAQIYQQIVQDLVAAQGNLNSIYVNATDTVLTSERIRPTVWVADALLARVYLYMGSGNYDKAEAEATKVIANTTLFSLLPDLNAVFKANSREAIWQIPNYSGTSIYYTPDATNNILTTGPSTTVGAASSTISTQLQSAFEIGDQRSVKWIGTFNNGSGSYNYAAKYKDISLTTTTPSEYTMIFRLAEQYLIRAEARVQQNNTSGALADINAIRNRAGLGNYTGATDQASLLTAIAQERQVELFCEGDRWFNLKRTGTIDAVMNIVTPLKANGRPWNSNQQLYPIRPLDLLYDKNLVQNPGY